jgi:sulfite exporter TauE/SafE
MLGSITPLGERGRGSRWWVTVTAYVLGSTVAGVAVGSGLGFVGSSVAGHEPVTARLVVVSLGVIAGLLLDVGSFGLRVPTVRRQVDEGWRAGYRGWVWGFGYGIQLGAGVVTVVTTSTVYVTWLAAALSGSAVAGAVIGATFGLARAIPVLSVAGVRRPDQLLHVDAVLARWAAPARRATYGIGAVVACLALLGAARW